MKKLLLGVVAAAALTATSATPAMACDPRLPTCDPQGTVDDVKYLVGQLTWPVERWLDEQCEDWLC